MYRKMSAVCAVALSMMLISSFAYADEFEPEPYQPDEFPQWAQDLRRGSVISFGALPVTLLVSRIFYDVGRFGVKSFEQQQLAHAYAPLFFAPADGVALTDADQIRILSIGVGAAVVVAIIDYALGRLESP